METPVLSQAAVPGVQVIVLVGDVESNPLLQRYIFIRDATDRNTGTGICKYGLAGGGMNPGESLLTAIVRECNEELGLHLVPVYHSSFSKRRPSGHENMNHLFFSYISPNGLVLQTNDLEEVSSVHVFTLEQIIDLYQGGFVHEGSIRLLFHFLNASEEGSLNEPVTFEKWTF